MNRALLIVFLDIKQFNKLQNLSLRPATLRRTFVLSISDNDTAI